MKRYTINALKLSFDQEGLRYQTEKELRVFYLDKLVGNFRVDLIVEDEVVVEVKSLAGNIPTVFESQLLSCFKSFGISCLPVGRQVGLLINFGNKSCQVERLIF